MRKGRKWLSAVISTAMVVQSLVAVGPVTVQAADGVSIDNTFSNDAAFRRYVSDNFDLNSDGYLDDDEISVVTSIDIHDIDTYYDHKAVQYVDGIELFTNLTSINCSGQGIRSMDIQNLTKLKHLDVSNNMMSDLTLPSKADDLIYLDISGNNITRLTSLADYDNLTHLDASGTNLEEINVKSMKGLTYLGVSGLSLKTLDLSENQQLDTIYCRAMSGLSTLDLSNHTNLKDVYCDAGSLNIAGSITKLDVSGDTALENLNCSANNLSELNITNTPKLSILNCANTKLDSLDVTNNKALTSLTVDGTALGSLNVSNNTALTSLSAADADLTEMDITKLSSLSYVNLDGNDLTSIDVSKNTALDTLTVSDNKLESINLSNNKNLRVLEVNKNRLVCIDISTCPKLLNSDEGGSFSCTGNSRDITLDKPNYDLDLTAYNTKYGFHKAYASSDIKTWNEKKQVYELGRKNTTIGYAGLALGEDNGMTYEVTGGAINNYHLTANLDSTEIKYKYFCGIGTRTVDFTLNILNPLGVVVWYSLDDGIHSAGDSTLKFVVGSTTTLTAKDRSGNTHENITWSSNNNKVAAINSKTGELTCKAGGTAQITTNLNGRPVGYINIECHNPVNKMSFIDRDSKNDDGTDIIYGDNSVINMECGRYSNASMKNLSAKFYNIDGEVKSEFAGYTCVVSDSRDNCDNVTSNVVSFRNGQITSVGPGVAYLHFTSKDNPESKIVIQVNVIQRVDSIQISQRKLSMIAGRTSTLTATFSPANADNQNVTWESSDDSIVSVDQDGKLTAHAPGTADITCIAADNPSVLKSKCTVTVLAAVSGVSMSQEECTLILPTDRSVQLSVNIEGDSSITYTEKWVSSDPEVARVASNGYVTAMKKGTAVITCYLADDLFAMCSITVKQNVTNVELSVEKNTLIVGDKIQAVAKVTPEDADNTTLKWSSSDESVATVDQNGNITAVDKGYAMITAAATDGSERYRAVGIQVRKLVADVKLEKNELVTYVGRATSMEVSVTPEDASDRSLIWESSDTETATVSGGPTMVSVRGVKPGEVTITAKTKDGSDIVRSFKVVVRQQITGITFAEPQKTVKVGTQFKCDYTVLPENADSLDIDWSSTDPSVATVSKDGTVSAIGRGMVVISAVPSDGVGTRASFTLNVNQPVTKIALNSTKVTLSKGGTYSLAANVIPDNANNTSVTWKTSNSKVATVTNGFVTAVAKGTAVITCKATDGSGKYARCTVSVVQPATSLRLSVTKKTMVKGTRYTLKAIVGPTTASNKKVTWTSSNKRVATVSATGVVKAVRPGTAVITCKTADGTGIIAKCTITSVIRVSKIKLNKTAAVIKKGGRVALRATVTPANASNKAVTWTSSNKKIATVTTSGVVVGKKAGRVVITCKAKDGSGKYARCTIVVK